MLFELRSFKHIMNTQKIPLNKCDINCYCLLFFSASGCPIANRHKLQRQQMIQNGVHEVPATLTKPIKMDGLT